MGCMNTKPPRPVAANIHRPVIEEAKEPVNRFDDPNDSQYGMTESLVLALEQVREMQRAQMQPVMQTKTEEHLKRSGKHRGTMRLPTGKSLAESEMHADCPLCLVEWEEGMKVMQLACHPTHMLHVECYECIVNFDDKHNPEPLCPVCRAPIDTAKAVKTILRAKGPNEEDEEDLASPNLAQVFSLDEGEESLSDGELERRRCARLMKKNVEEPVPALQRGDSIADNPPPEDDIPDIPVMQPDAM